MILALPSYINLMLGKVIKTIKGKYSVDPMFPFRKIFTSCVFRFRLLCIKDSFHAIIHTLGNRNSRTASPSLRSASLHSLFVRSTNGKYVNVVIERPSNGPNVCSCHIHKTENLLKFRAESSRVAATVDDKCANETGTFVCDSLVAPRKGSAAAPQDAPFLSAAETEQKAAQNALS